MHIKTHHQDKAESLFLALRQQIQAKRPGGLFLPRDIELDDVHSVLCGQAHGDMCANVFVWVACHNLLETVKYLVESGLVQPDTQEICTWPAEDGSYCECNHDCYDDYGLVFHDSAINLAARAGARAVVKYLTDCGAVVDPLFIQD